MCAALALCIASGCPRGDWPEPRQNARLTAVQPVPGRMSGPPTLLAKYDVGRKHSTITPVVLPNGKGFVGLTVVAGKLYCFDTKGNLLWSSQPPGLSFEQMAAVEDLDGDGTVEILIQAGRPGWPYGAAVLLRLSDGSVIWRYDVEPMSNTWFLYAGHYLPGIESKQIVVLMNGLPPDPWNGYITMFDFPAKGAKPEQRWRYDFDKYTANASFYQTDFDGDGTKDLAIETHSRLWFLDPVTGGFKYFFGWWPLPAHPRSYGLSKFIDLDQDGLDDFLCIADFAQHHEVLLNQGGSFRLAWYYAWPDSVTIGQRATIWCEPPHVDIDGDGGLEIVVSMFNSEEEENWLIRAYDAVTGVLKYRMPGMIAVTAADIDHDGMVEVLADVCTESAGAVRTGARLLRAHDGALDVVWTDDNAKCVPDRIYGKPLVKKHGAIYELVTTEGGGFALQHWIAPPKQYDPDFSKIPALEGPRDIQLLAADVVGDPDNDIVVYREPHLQSLALRDGSMGQIRTYRVKENPALTDPDGDGVLQLTAKEMNSVADPRVDVLELRANGLQRTRQYRSNSQPVIADLDLDGRNEIILSDVNAQAIPRITAITPSQMDRLRWSVQLPPPPETGQPQRRVAYLRTGHFTGKDTPDIYVWAGLPQARSVLLDGATGSFIWELGTVSAIERFTAPTENYASVYDFDGDGCEDLVFTNPDHFCIASGRTGQLLKGPISPQVIFSQSNQGLLTFPALLAKRRGAPTVFLGGGLNFEAAITMHAKPLWYTSTSVGESRFKHEGFIELKDGQWAVGYCKQNGTFVCLNARDGSTRWELPLKAATTHIISCDVDADGRYEFVFGTTHSELYAVGDDGDRPRIVWKVMLSAPAEAPIAADLDGDGASEIILATADGYVNVYGAGK